MSDHDACGGYLEIDLVGQPPASRTIKVRPLARFSGMDGGHPAHVVLHRWDVEPMGQHALQLAAAKSPSADLDEMETDADELHHRLGDDPVPSLPMMRSSPRRGRRRRSNCGLLGPSLAQPCRRTRVAGDAALGIEDVDLTVEPWQRPLDTLARVAAGLYFAGRSASGSGVGAGQPPRRSSRRRSAAHPRVVHQEFVKARRRAQVLGEWETLNRLRTPSGIAAFERRVRADAYGRVQRRVNGIHEVPRSGSLHEHLGENLQSIETQTQSEDLQLQQLQEQNEQALEDMAQADLAYLDMVLHKAGIGRPPVRAASATNRAMRAISRGGNGSR